ncbi:hypothetical protein [Achromobacter xylosoxidans]|uniref:hypothetical protein n=1 Tax=Alcaligenes xylosoxydans xylosoxydans TaxID=85698 RepID=UPI001F12B735|nr:hypothetical protein [Achromobacter xylosoxidans]
MTQQDDITQRVLTDDEILAATLYGQSEARMIRNGRAIESALLSKLRAPVADDGLTPKQAWWAGYRVGKGLPPDTPRQDAVKVSISSARLVTRWPDGTPRDERDIASDPEGKLIHDPDEPLRAAIAPVAGEAQPANITSRRLSGVLSMDGASLHMQPDGSGQIIVAEDDFTLEDDRDEGPDGPQGSAHWVARLPASEIAALRDFLTGHARPSDDALWDQTLTERDEYHDMADKLANAIADHLLVEIGEHSSSNCPWMRALEAIENAAPQASAENVRNAALEEAAHLMEQTGKRIAASDIRALKTQADKDGGQQLRWRVTDDMRYAVRFAPSSAHWSERLKEFFGPDAREGIDALERQLREAHAMLDRQPKLRADASAVRRALIAASNYIDTLGGDSKSYRAALYAPQAEQGERKDG